VSVCGRSALICRQNTSRLYYTSYTNCVVLVYNLHAISITKPKCIFKDRPDTTSVSGYNDYYITRVNSCLVG